jgi:hypothetical protein
MFTAPSETWFLWHQDKPLLGAELTQPCGSFLRSQLNLTTLFPFVTVVLQLWSFHPTSLPRKPPSAASPLSHMLQLPHTRHRAAQTLPTWLTTAQEDRATHNSRLCLFFLHSLTTLCRILQC